MKNAVLAIFAFSVAVGFGFAQEQPRYPRKDITFIIPFNPGGGTDVMGRQFITALSKQITGTNLVPVNITGASGTVGALEVLNSRPDGYKLLIASPGLAVPYLMGNFQKTYKDFTPVAAITDSNIAMYVNAKSPYKTLEDLVNDAKANPNKVKIGVSLGTLLHVAGLYIEDRNGITFKKVVIGGSSPKPPELLSRRVDTYLASISEGTPYILSGDFRALAIFSDRRNVALPDVPTFAELGYQSKFQQVFGIWAPPNTPPAIVDFLTKAAEKACGDPEFAKQLEVSGSRPYYLDPVEYREQLAKSFTEQEVLAKYFK